MKTIAYKLDKTGDFIIENYNRAKAFSSFFPGIAGLYGIPLWAFYVNRGQCITSFGIKDKDGAILEFLPANQAYNLTPIKGFRTFLKLKKKRQSIFYEPFRETNNTNQISTKIIINPSKLEIEEINRALGIRINSSYITIPNEFFAGIARRVVIENISKNKLEIELLDGLPHIIPFGVTEWHQKHMSRTIEAWMRVLNLENGAPFYNLKIDPQDRPELAYIKRGNFYIGCRIDGTRVSILKPVVDPDIVFGKSGDISYPRIFVEERSPITSKEEICEGKTPSAFAYSMLAVKAGQSKKIVSIIGNTRDMQSANVILRKIKNDADYFEKKLSENKDIIANLENRVFTKSSSEEFDFYSRQTYLDNLLRGGFPISIGTSKGSFVYYGYARKHGDMERDYNAFLLQPSYYSQGNGAYRDINQNRRNDTLFNPDVKDENILTFVNAIQPDGFNPHLIEGIILSIKNRKALGKVLRNHINRASNRKRIRSFLRKGFTPGSLLFFLEKEKIAPRNERDGFLKDILAISAREDVIMPGEGYWIDHWTYNIDLFENYLACYPEKLKELLLDKRVFTFYDTYLRPVPRCEKYVYPVRDIKDTGQKNKISNGVYVDGKVRQFGAVREDETKKCMIEERAKEPHKVRTSRGKGSVYKTNLLAKLICVIANKMASLDPFGTGIEMEAGKPGWCDGLNGLPGIFGSSLCEVFELKRLILFIKSSLDRLKVSDSHKIELPLELADFLTDLGNLIRKNLSQSSKEGDFLYWDSSQERKERYREEVWPGFGGGEKTISIETFKDMLEGFLLKIEKAINRGYGKKNRIPQSYFINEVKRFSFIYEKGKKKLNKDKQPLVKALSFSQRPVSLFLEGPVHAMRVMELNGAKSLYRAVRKSEIFDKKLKMYKVNEPLKGEPLEIGRSAIFTPGWLENESVWLHMEYKYLLELLKVGLYEEFFNDFKNCLVAFQDPRRYGRSILENSSFIVSSAYPDRDIHGNGFVARLTGTTAEFLTMWLLMTLGKSPFALDSEGKLYFKPKPIIPGWLFARERSVLQFYLSNGNRKTVILPKNIFAACLLGRTLMVYRNPKRCNTFGKNAVIPTSIILKKKGRSNLKFNSGKIPPPYALQIREGLYDRIDIELS